MKVKQLDIQSFRSYPYAQISFDEQLNLLIGKNAEGKTTLLEALAIFAYGRSPRARHDRDLIKFDHNETRLRLLVESHAKTTDLAVKITSKGKQVMVNRVTKKNLSEFLGQFHAVYFSPDDLQIIKQGPEERRRFLNFSMAQTAPELLGYLHSYNHVLMQRNHLLKMRQTGSLDIWEEQMSESGAQIIALRRAFADRLQKVATAHYGTLASGPDELCIEYRTCCDEGMTSEISEHLRNSLARSRNTDVQRGYTTVGPHRDDFAIKISGRAADRFASQGQQRSAILALKLGLVDIIHETTGEHPVLLLDDVLSELDELRQSQLFDIVERTQTIITTTHPDQIPHRLSPPPKAFHVAHGIISVEGM